MLAPVSLFVYNRLAHTKKTIFSLQQNELAKDTVLYIYSDGPKDEKNIAEVNKVRDFIKNIKGFKDICITEQEKNLGLAKSIIYGVSETVTKEDKIIVLEDDMISSKYFLKFMNEALDFYEKKDKIMAIHGYTQFFNIQLPDNYFLSCPGSWGWATWKNRWDLFEYEPKKLKYELTKKKLFKKFEYGNSVFTNMLQNLIDGKIESWAICWHALAVINNKLTLYPGKSLIDNIGNDCSGVHSGKTNMYDTKISESPVPVKKIPIEESLLVRKLTKQFLINNFGEKKLSKIYWENLKRFLRINH
jgi:hypothetical protein